MLSYCDHVVPPFSSLVRDWRPTLAESTKSRLGDWPQMGALAENPGERRGPPASVEPIAVTSPATT